MLRELDGMLSRGSDRSVSPQVPGACLRNGSSRTHELRRSKCSTQSSSTEGDQLCSQHLPEPRFANDFTRVVALVHPGSWRETHVSRCVSVKEGTLAILFLSLSFPCFEIPNRNT